MDNFQFEFLSLTPPHNTINVFSSGLFCCLTESREKESDKLFFTGKRNPEECFWLKWKLVVSLPTTAVERPFCRKLTSLTEIREEIIPIFGGKWSRVCHDQMSQRQSGEHPKLEYSCFWNKTMFSSYCPLIQALFLAETFSGWDWQKNHIFFLR